MNPIAEEIESYLGSASITDEEYLAHYGMPRRSGRYPWGSGEDPYQSSRDFLILNITHMEMHIHIHGHWQTVRLELWMMPQMVYTVQKK